MVEIKVHPDQVAPDSLDVAYLGDISKQVSMEQAALVIRIQAMLGLVIRILVKAIINRIITQVIRVTPRS